MDYRDLGRRQCIQMYPELGICERSGCSAPAVDRHHKDRDTWNNERSNIEFLCRRCHTITHGGNSITNYRPHYREMVGKTFGRLTVLRALPRRGSTGKIWWRCRCACGTETDVDGTHLRTRGTKSCGCLQREIRDFRLKNQTKHGLRSHPLYSVWRGMKKRCYDPRDLSFKRYGGRGIYVCAEWLSDPARFIADMGPRPKGASIERKDNNGPYSKENCVWATPKEQANNYRRNVLITLNGVTRNVTQWAAIIGVQSGTIFRRIYDGMPPERVLYPGSLRYAKSK